MKCLSPFYVKIIRLNVLQRFFSFVKSFSLPSPEIAVFFHLLIQRNISFCSEQKVLSVNITLKCKLASSLKALAHTLRR